MPRKTRPARPVHYAANGNRLKFQCFDQEAEVFMRTGKAYPKHHTDLRKVTCPHCWRYISDMADERI